MFSPQLFLPQASSRLRVSFFLLVLVLGFAGLPIAAHATQTLTTTTVTASPTNPTPGQAVVLTVTVTVGGVTFPASPVGPPVTQGQVALCNGFSFACSPSEAFAVLQLNASGQATTTFYSVGEVGVQAGFSGTSAYTASHSANLDLIFPNVNIPTVTTLAAPTGTPGAYSLTATVTAYSPMATSQPSTPEAAMNFYNNSNSGTSGPQLLGSVNTFNLPSGIALLPGTALAAGTNPSYVASGDFNNDGHTDLAVVNTGDNTVSILMCNGDGTFQTQVPYPTGASPGPIVVGDFNNDGKLDLAIVNNADKTVSILFGKGDGTFFAQVPYATGVNPIALAIGDMNQDGISDLVVLNHDDKTIGVLMNNGDGTFAAQATYAIAGNDPRSISVGDITLTANTNGFFTPDGFPDVAVANFADNTISFFYNAGDGTLILPVPQTSTNTITTGNGPIAVSLANASDDASFSGQNVLAGYSSISYLNYTDNTLTVIPAQRQGAGPKFAAAINYPTGAHPLAFIFNFNDTQGAPEPVVLNSDGTLSVFLGSHEYDGTYVLPGISYPATAGAVSLVSGQFNADSDQDIVVGGSATSAASLLLQQEYYQAIYTLSNVQVPGTSTSNVIATYPGDASFQTSSSAPVVLTDSPIITATSLSINPTHAVSPGQATTLTATVSPTSDGPLYNITGTVLFTDTSTAPATVICAAASINSLGVATCTTAALNIAVHVFTATYSGDQYFSSSAAATRTLSVANVTTTALALSASSVTVGTPVNALVSVTETNLGNAAVNGGTVNFCESTALFCTGTALLGTAQLQRSNGAAPGTVAVPLLLPAGKHSIQAVSLGTNTDASSFSPAKPLTVISVVPTTTTITQSGSGSNLALSAAVASASSNPVTGGTITFSDGSNSFFNVTATLPAASFSSAFNTAVKYTDPDVSNVVKDMRVASLRANGVMDMIYPNYDDSTIGVRLGTIGIGGIGTGTFGAEVDYAIPAGFSCPTSVAVADFNGDGKPDIAVADNCALAIYVFLGNGDGTFPSTPNFTYDIDSTFVVVSPVLEAGPNGITTGDFNRDGIMDIATASSEGINYILLGVGDGSFQAPVAYNAITFQSDTQLENILSADMNGDGNPDLVYTEVASGAISIMLGNGDGTFQTPIDNYNTGEVNSIFTGTVNVADFNDDGIPDAVITYSGGDMNVLIGNGDGTFQDGTVYTTSNASPFGIAIADFNGDGVPDIAVALLSGNAVGIFLGKSNSVNNGDGTVTLTPNGTFANMTKIAGGGSGNEVLASGDFNGDGIPDIVVNSSFSGPTPNNAVLIGKQSSSATAKASHVVVPGSATASAHTIKASYPGDTFHTASVSSSIGVIGTPITTVTTLAVSPSSPTPYGGIVLTATITPGTISQYVSSGTVTFKDSTTSLTPAIALSSGKAIYSYTPALGSHSYTSVYAGDANFKTSTNSPAMSDTVVKGTPVITWTPPDRIDPGSTLSGVLTATATVAGAFTYTATLSGGSPVTVTSTTVLTAGSYSIVVSFVPTDTTDYNTPAAVSSPLAVGGENIWIVNSGGNLSGLFNTGAALTATATSGGGLGIAIDRSGDIWSANAAGSTLVEFEKGGAVLNGSIGGGGLNSPVAVAIDGNNAVWIVNGTGSVSVFTNAGLAISPAVTGYTGGALNTPTGIAIDISGNVWISNSGNDSATEILGGAGPVVSIAIGTKNSTLGVKP